LIPEALYYILTQRFPSPISHALNACLAFALNSSLFLLLIYPEMTQLNTIPNHLWLLIGIQGLSLSMNYFLWLKGCEYASQTTVALSSAFMPLITLGLAVLFLHEHLNSLQILGVGLILSTLFLHQKTSSKTD
jgi:drug/metabolite transporter (DMT)-like permease